MIPAGEVQAGTLVFLECGCSGYRGVSRIEGPAFVVVQRPCESHADEGPGQIRRLQYWELVSPFRPYSPELNAEE